VLPVTGLTGRGVQWRNRAYVDIKKSNTRSALIGITGHEAQHWLEQNDPDAARAFREGMAPYLRDDAVSLQQAFENANLVEGEAPVDAAAAHSEVMSNINGAMWLDPKFWQRMYEIDNGSTMRRVLYQFMRGASKLARVASGSLLDAKRYVTDVDAVR
jgi:hypothetical protein